jgi:hypothetical protein
MTIAKVKLDSSDSRDERIRMSNWLVEYCCGFLLHIAKFCSSAGARVAGHESGRGARPGTILLGHVCTRLC